MKYVSEVSKLIWNKLNILYSKDHCQTDGKVKEDCPGIFILLAA